MTRLRWLFVSLAVNVLGVGCTCVALPDAIFACEPDGGCGGQPGYVCGSDAICRLPGDGGPVDPDAGSSGDASLVVVDAGGLDGGLVVIDASVPDSGLATDAGIDSGMGAFDAGTVDGGTRADAGGAMDAGFDAGMEIDAGFDAGGSFDAGPVDAGCVPSADEPDDLDQLGVDTNCDGIDGDLSIAALVDTVTGDDLGGDGSKIKPYKTITKALTTNKTQILVSKGTYAESFTVRANRVFGGYDQAAGWSRTGSRPLIVGTITMLDNGTDRITLDFFNVSPPLPLDAGQASVAVYAVGVDAGSIIRRSVLHSNAGRAAQSGAQPAAAANGVNGSEGISSIDGGFGAPLTLAPVCSFGSSSGLEGGAGGAGAQVEGDGQTGFPFALGGDGGIAIVCSVLPCAIPPTGANGLADFDGMPGGPGTFGLTGDFMGTAWVTNLGGTGDSGGPGKGGGGAGGGGSVTEAQSMFVYLGGGGGSGGSGGCGGSGAPGGRGGGASVALLLTNATPTLESNTLQTGAGGAGGAGGEGGLGGQGGIGGIGGNGANLVGGGGGRGANGSRGGKGGQGGGGAGGPSIGIWCGPNAAPKLVGATNVYVIGTAGAGGSPNGISGIAAETLGCP